jgi:hypothetical protein
MKQIKIILGAVTQLHYKIQIKHPQVSQDAITMTNNRKNVYTIKYEIYNTYSELYT